jgi:hypothetical protein
VTLPPMPITSRLELQLTNLVCVLGRVVLYPSAGLKDRSLFGQILIMLLILPQLVVRAE